MSNPSPLDLPFQEPEFDMYIRDWYPRYQTSLSWFVLRGQLSDRVKAVAALINIKLPWQQKDPEVEGPYRQGHVTLVPYIRRLVATGYDFPWILQAFFGESYAEGIGVLLVAERRNYLFAAKSETWLRVKSHYDMQDGQSIPFLRPLRNVDETQIAEAESGWSEWLAMQDWMLGPRAPPDVSARTESSDS
ncbi:hypothetical protein CP533_3300 [Ophiocordyceps camponoti-saundersi (nom. inval.)]|nr:hypothetical protein CP533_3300 [Ophiocordyceps camponoti-saundersi (nom. inval.)]